MEQKSVQETAKRITLRDFLVQSNIKINAETVEVVNECNETLVTLTGIEDYVAGIDKVLRDELLDREVLKISARLNAEIRITVEGIDDAE